MTRAETSAAFLFTAAAIAAVVLWPRRASASTQQTLPESFSDGYLWVPQVSYGEITWPVIEPAMIDQSEQRVRAFLYMIRSAEHDPTYSDGERYGLFYSSIPFTNYADHPANTGEVSPVRLPDRFCKPAGLNPPCYSTAAGAYQIIRPTWNRIRQRGVWGEYLQDFSPTNQDEAARRLLYERGALEPIKKGNLEDAVRRVASVWASLPGSTAQQGGRSMNEIYALFNQGMMVA